MASEADEQIAYLLETAENRLKAFEDELEKLESVYIPKDIETALEEGWAMTAANTAAMAALGFNHHKEDRQRVMKLTDAIRLIFEHEQQLVKLHVDNPVAVLLGPVRGIATMIRDAWRARQSLVLPAEVATEIAVDAWDTLSFYDLVMLGFYTVHAAALALRAVFGRMFKLWEVAAMAEAYVKAASMRAEIEAKMRRKFLPQRGGPRYRRRKQAR